MRTVVFALVFVSPPFLKAHILRWLCGARIGRRVRVGWFAAVAGARIEIGDYAEVRSFSLIRCDGDVRIGAYSVISNFVLVYGSASVILGRRCYVGPLCLINADEDVRMGDVSALGPGCMVFTHGSFLPYTEGYWTRLAGVSIGDHVWIAAGVFIHPGVEVGSHVFVNSRSVLKQSVAAGDVVEGFPAARVTEMTRVRRTMTPRRVDGAAGEIVARFAEMVLRRRLDLEVSRLPDGLRFRYRRRAYRLLSVTSAGGPEAAHDIRPDERLIVLANRADWTPPPHVRRPMVFNLVTMRTRRSRDRVHAALWRFMRQYFGVTFEYE